MRARDYQQHAADAVWDYFVDNSGHPLVLMPTGTGKSIVPPLFIQRMFRAYPGSRVMLATHVETLIAQNFEKLIAFWPTAPAGIFSAGLNRKDVGLPITFGGVQSMWTCPELFGHVDILFIDEAHLVSPKESGMYAALIAGLQKVNPQLKIIGLTATGWRTDNGALVDGGIFTDIAVDMTTTESWNYFVDAGYLSPLYSKRTALHIDADGVAIAGRDYNLKQLAAHVDHEHITRQAIQEMLWWGDTERRDCWMVFATGVNHCEHVRDMLEEYGVNAVAVHSKSKNPDKLLADFKAGRYRAAVSMNKLTTGVDIPQIDLIGVMRHTLSSNLWVQMLGRGTRPVYAPGYDLNDWRGRLAAIAAGPKPNGCRVCDFVRNTENLGPINAPIIPQRRKKKGGGGAPPIRVCEKCGTYCHPSVRFCTHCGFEFPVRTYMDGVSSDLDVMVRADAPVPQPDPIVERLTVVSVTCNLHRKKNRPNSLRVSYFCKGQGNIPRMFSEYVCFEHIGPARSRAERWWRERCTDFDPPAETARALELERYLRVPRTIDVWINPPSNHPEINSYGF